MTYLNEAKIWADSASGYLSSRFGNKTSLEALWCPSGPSVWDMFHSATKLNNQNAFLPESPNPRGSLMLELFKNRGFHVPGELGVFPWPQQRPISLSAVDMQRH